MAIGKIQTLFSDEAKTQIIFPHTKIKAVSNEDGSQNLKEILENHDARWAGAWIEFTDENGNPSDEPYLHYTVDDSGNPSYNGPSFAEDGEY